MKARMGQRFGKLKVIGINKKVILKSGVYKAVLCKCACGNSKIIRLDYLKQGTKSCGCEKGGFSHRLSKHKLYDTWQGMMHRCYNKKSHIYKYYGGRGVTVDKRWHSIKKFIEDMGDKPNDNYTLDRIDNSKGYSKENCKWSTPLEQSYNTRSNRIFNHNGEMKNLKQLSIETGIKYTTLWHRINNGWELNKALNK